MSVTVDKSYVSLQGIDIERVFVFDLHQVGFHYSEHLIHNFWNNGIAKLHVGTGVRYGNQQWPSRLIESHEP